ncbi:hypothetical protein [Microbacterium arborescens]|uniref:hypothetical protein n=1 Tax=Microbacterium arborescens TaxID=33883 RepID=UPI0027863F2F|nr:hypothetical protein [Microbacterium arborescens]MDQ1217984.1 hypothetical protein [Microbacterium arborescens]
MTIQSEALALVPGYADRDGDEQRIATLRRGLNSPEFGREMEEARLRYEHAIATSSDIVAVRDAFFAFESAKLTEAAFGDIQTRLQGLRTAQRENNRSFTESELAPALRFVHRRLDELMARVRESDRALGSVTTVEEAVRGSDAVIAAWRDATDAVVEYDEIRRVQNMLTFTMFDGRGGDIGDALRMTGRIRNAFDHDAPWVRERLDPGRARYTENRLNASIFEWVKEVSRPSWERETLDVWPVGDQVAYLRWLATTATPWVPTHDELLGAHQALLALTGTLSTFEAVDQALTAYDSYFTRRGVEPVSPLNVASVRALMDVRPKRLAGR